MLYNVASCWLYLKEYMNDARSHERQKDYATSYCRSFVKREPLPELNQALRLNTYVREGIQLHAFVI